MLVVFLALVGPYRCFTTNHQFDEESELAMQLLQPVGLKNNDSLNDTQTGTGAPGRAASTGRVYFSHWRKSDCSREGMYKVSWLYIR